MFKKWLFSFLLLSAFADAETLFYKKDGSLITSQEHEVLYKIMLETQFPMSAAYGNYYKDEIKAMNEKIQKQLPNSGIEATFIPTTLYEMFCLNYVRDNFNKVEKATFNVLNYFKLLHGLVSTNVIVPSKDLFSEITKFKEINLDGPLIEWHHAINNYILKTLKEKNMALPITFDKALESLKIIDFWHGQITYPYLMGHFIISPQIKNSLIPADMERAIAIEYNAFNTNTFPIYRGSDYVDDYNDKSQSNNRSISFGSTLLGGLLFDPSACAYDHMANKSLWAKKLGYVVFINKKEYLLGQLSNMFYIPPIITLLDLIGKGEYFHARTKVIHLTQAIQGISVIHKKDININDYQIKASTIEEAQKIHNQMLQYIKEHHLVFREKPKARL